MFSLRTFSLFLLFIGLLNAHVVYGAGGAVKDPLGTAPDRYVYYPGTEELKKDEIRLFACGTGAFASRFPPTPRSCTSFP